MEGYFKLDNKSKGAKPLSIPKMRETWGWASAPRWFWATMGVTVAAYTYYMTTADVHKGILFNKRRDTGVIGIGDDIIGNYGPNGSKTARQMVQEELAAAAAAKS